MRHLSKFSVSTTAVNNKDYNSEWIDTQIFSITLDTNYNRNDNEITASWMETDSPDQEWQKIEISLMYVLFAEKYSLQIKPLHKKRREREREEKMFSDW